LNSGNLHVRTPFGSVAAAYPFPTNEWHYVMVVGGNGHVALYVDGIQLADLLIPISSATFDRSDRDFNIGGGGLFGPTGKYFLGQIDEVAVWQRALSADEIAMLVSTNSEQISFTNQFNTDVRTQMFGANSTACVRIPFTVTNVAEFDSLKLLMRYDDGFVAYLNGHEIARSNAPAILAWDSAATQRHRDADAVQWEEFDVNAARTLLQSGSNVLAIRALNLAAANSDFLMQAQLLGETITDLQLPWRYFTQPTPSAPNGVSDADAGPIMSGAGHWPNVPQATDSLVVTTLVAQAYNTISNVTLNYRVMFNREIAVTMNDSGTNGDVTAGDGTWTGVIPGGKAVAGEMIRYYVTAFDSAGYSSRWPIFPDPTTAQQYLGTVVVDASIQTQLPVVQMFMERPSYANYPTGTRASLFYFIRQLG